VPRARLTGDSMTTTPVAERAGRPTTIDSVVIRFCGDSGDGMQLTGTQFTGTTAVFGNDFATFPDYPAEIRAPKGTTYGVSGFQVHFSSRDIHTHGDDVNVLVAMNPAGFKTNIRDVQPGGIVIVNEDEFTTAQLKKCGYPERYNPLQDDEMIARYEILAIPMSRLTRESLADSDMGAKAIDRCRNMYALGMVYWMYDRPLDPTIEYLNTKFASKGKAGIAEINIKALKAGYYFGETAEIFPAKMRVPPARLDPGVYRRISGSEAMVLGLVTAGHKAGKRIVYASYPITPASNIIQGLANLKRLGAKTFQAEDEMAAVCAAIGASYAGNIGVTGTSGPGLALKAEAIGLAVMLELPLVVIDVQRAGPSTGMPTKTEQADLLMALFGRSGECPCIVLAPRSPGDCFWMSVQAVRLAIRHSCPVIVLSDAYVANGAEPWRVPDLDDVPAIEAHHPTREEVGEEWLRYARDAATGAPAWVIPGTPGLEHRIGGLEKGEDGNVSYDPENHAEMTRLRAEKVARAADVIPPLQVRGEESGEVLMLGWGGTYGAITTAADDLRAMGHSVSSVHLRHLNPMPRNTEAVLRRFDRVIIPEINSGQLSMLIRSRFLIDAVGINIVRGRPLNVDTLIDRVIEIMGWEGDAS
jgi:2-oxoglutarate ferredoxin oxidoreductase subunit alpha